MTKQEKEALVQELTERLRENPQFYLVDIGGFTVAKTNALRAKCFAANVELKVVKNTLVRKSLEAIDGNFEELFPVLKQETAVLFVSDNPKAPAKLVKDFRGDDEKPRLKAAYVQDTVFVGDESLDQLVNLKSKNDLIADVVALLESPIKNVISALKSGEHTIAGLVKALEERKS